MSPARRSLLILVVILALSGAVMGAFWLVDLAFGDTGLILVLGAIVLLGVYGMIYASEAKP